MFTIDPTAAERCDVGIVVPKMDERLGLESSWGIDLGRPHGRLAGKKFWGVRMGDLNLVVVFLDDQGPAPARGIAEQLLLRFRPPLLFLLGTAAGREDKTRIGTPITGRSLWAAATPGSAADMPAPAMITFSPRMRALVQYSRTISGSRWALITRTS